VAPGAVFLVRIGFFRIGQDDRNRFVPARAENSHGGLGGGLGGLVPSYFLRKPEAAARRVVRRGSFGG